MTTTITYEAMTSRNIGLITEKEQRRLRGSVVAVLGMGGIGGVVAELLARAGVGRLKIVDRDVFEVSNLNRQIFAYAHTVGRKKTEVAREFLLGINPGLKVDVYDTVSEDNADDVVSGADAIVLGIDTVAPCIAAMRAARARGIPAVEGWAIPYGNVRVIDSGTPSLEELYDLPTLSRPLAGISEKELAMLDKLVLASLGRIPGVAGYYPPEVRAAMSDGSLPLRSFAPMVWLASVLVATETIKVLLGRGRVARAPAWALYDPYEHRALHTADGKDSS